MNTYKQINIMIGLLFVGMVGTFLYWIWDNGYDLPLGIHVDSREVIARDRQEEEQTDRGAFIYARNCRSCHGLTGAGALERTGLPGAALNAEGNRPPELKDADIAPLQARFTGTIHCGRNGTVMPPWSTEEGGSLNDFQILQLVTLITSRFSVEAGWEHAVEYANEADETGKHLEDAIGEDDDEIVLSDVSNIAPETEIRIGGETLDDPYEVLGIIEVDPETRTLTVERGASGSDALEHESGAEIFLGPIPPSETITGVDTAPTCGQGAPNVGGGGEAVALADGDTIDMQDNVFVVDDTENPTFTVPAGAVITLTNSGVNPHNLRVDGPDGEYQTDDDAAPDDLLAEGESGDIVFDLDPGTYGYQCDVHPALMLGEVTVE